MQIYLNIALISKLRADWGQEMLAIIHNFACCFVWVWNLVVDIAGGKEAEGVWEYGVEENIWT